MLELDNRRCRRWQHRRGAGRLDDSTAGGTAVHAITPTERRAIVELFERWGDIDGGYRKLAHRGSYENLVWVSPSTLYRVLAAQGLVLPARPQRTPAPARPLPDWIEWRRHQIWIYDITHFPRAGRVAYAILDVVTRKWLATLVTAEETATQVEVVFTRSPRHRRPVARRRGPPSRPRPPRRRQRRRADPAGHVRQRTPDESNVADDHGRIMVRETGECSYIPDTAGWYDFQIPCKAHDYCYDLREASFSATVTDDDCDEALNDLLDAHCNNRSFLSRLACHDTRRGAHAAVSSPGVVTDPNPGIVEIRNKVTSKCAEIEGPFSTAGTPIQQWDCVGRGNQQFRFWPSPGAAGYFRIVPVDPQRRCARMIDLPVLWTCNDSWNSQRFRIRDVTDQNEYTIRSRYNQSLCWSIPYSHENGINLANPSCFEGNNWLIWRIQSAT